MTTRQTFSRGKMLLQPQTQIHDTGAVPRATPGLSHPLLPTAELCWALPNPTTAPLPRGAARPRSRHLNPPPLSSTMTVWQRASSLRNSLSTGSLSLWAASSSVTSQTSNFCSPGCSQLSPEPCKRHRQDAGARWDRARGSVSPGAPGMWHSGTLLARTQAGG